mgnify:CR=1 FL=1
MFEPRLVQTRVRCLNSAPQAFEAYTDPLLLAKSGRKEMNIVGFCRFLRDCHLLDNRLTLVHADVIFTKVDAGSYMAAGSAQNSSSGGVPLPPMPGKQQSQASTSTLPGVSGRVRWAQRVSLCALTPALARAAPCSGCTALRRRAHAAVARAHLRKSPKPIPLQRPPHPSPAPFALPRPQDLHVDYTEFLRCMAAVVRVKFPHAADPREALLLATRKWVLPFARLGADGGGLGLGCGPASAADSLFDRSAMNLLRTYDSQLKRLYAWWARGVGAGAGSGAGCRMAAGRVVERD